MVMNGVGDEFLPVPVSPRSRTWCSIWRPCAPGRTLPAAPSADEALEEPGCTVRRRLSRSSAMVFFLFNVQRQANAWPIRLATISTERVRRPANHVRCIRLHRQHAVQVAAQADRRGNERQTSVVKAPGG